MIFKILFQLVFNLGRAFNKVIREISSSAFACCFHRNKVRTPNIKYKHIENLLLMYLFQTILYQFPWKLRNTYLDVKHSGFFCHGELNYLVTFKKLHMNDALPCSSETEEYDFFKSFQRDNLKNLVQISDRLQRISLLPCL